MSRMMVALLSGGTVEAATTDSLIALLADPTARERIASHYTYTSGPLLADARTRIARHFLTTTAAWLLTVDSDMVFTPDQVVTLLDDAVQGAWGILGAACMACVPTTGASHIEAAAIHDGQLWSLKPSHLEQRPMLVHAVGAGLCLVHRSVFVKLDTVGPFPWYAEEAYGGQLVGEDWTFCLRAGEAGVRVGVHGAVRVGHVKRFTITVP